MILYLTALAVLVAGVGVMTRSWAVLLVAVFLATPLALYLSMTSRFRGFGLLLAVPPFVAAPFVTQKRSVAGSLVAIFALGFIAVEAMVLGAF